MRCEVLPNTPLSDGHDAVRDAFSGCYFDEEGCSLGFMRLSNYSRRYDFANATFRDEPRKNDHKHGADAFRYSIVGMPFKEEEDASMYRSHRVSTDNIW